MSADAFGATLGSVANAKLPQKATAKFWQKFDLQTSPFEDSKGDLFCTSQHGVVCSQLQRFRASQNSLILFPSVVGGGVTTLLHKFIKEQHDPSHIHYVLSNPRMGLDQLIKSLSDKFATIKNVAEEIPLLLEQLALLNQEVGSQLLIIDDAHRLTKETLVGLLLLLSQQDLHITQFRVVLCGDLQLEMQVEGLFRELELTIPHQKVSLAPFTLNETQDYLQYRFNQVGFNDRIPFSLAMIKQVHRLSGGYPGRINRVAQQVLIDNHKDERGFMNFKTNIMAWLQERKLRLLSIALLTSALCVMWWMQENGVISNMVEFARTRIVPQPMTLASNDHIDKISHHDAPTPTEAAKILISAISAAMPPQEEVAEVENIPTINLKQQVRNSHATSPATDATPAALPTKAAASVPAPQQVIQKKPENQVASEKPQAPQNEPVLAANSSPASPAQTSTALQKGLDDIRDAENDLLQLKGYTIQLMGSSQADSISNFIKSQQLDYDDVAYFETTNNSKPWYVLVYKQYDTMDEARTALAQLPKGLRSHGPWIKSFDAIHTAIKAKG